MGRQIDKVRDDVRLKFLNYQRTKRLVESVEFEAMYDKASPERRVELECAASNGEYYNLKMLMDELCWNDYQALDITTLKRRAKRLKIHNWYRLDKINLIEALEDARRNQKVVPRSSPEGGEAGSEQTQIQEDGSQSGQVLTTGPESSTE